MPSVTRSSIVHAPPAEVWARVTTFAGINHELRPLMRMTPPRRRREETIETVPVGVPLGRFAVRYLGVLPLDHSEMTLAEVVPGSRFHEVSTMGSMRHWEHRRVLEAVDGGTRTRVTDALVFEPRLPAGRLAALIVGGLFAHRHRRLRAWFAR